MTKAQILLAPLKAASHGKELERPYRAVLTQRNNRWYITIDQPIGDDWCPTSGQWALGTLLADMPDSIFIDFGQRWEITSGLRKALLEALTII